MLEIGGFEHGDGTMHAALPDALIHVKVGSRSGPKNESGLEDDLMTKMLAGAAAVLGLLASMTTASAQVPVAVVEDVQGRAAGIGFMDYVAAGQVIRLGAKDSLVLGYLRSCWRETIVGGTVTVGNEQSTVQSGTLRREKVACDAGRAPSGARSAGEAAATVFRSLRSDVPPARTPPPTVYGLSPVVEVGARRGRLVIERLDPEGDRTELAIEGDALVQGRFVDLVKVPLALMPGATYAASLGPLRIEFKVDWDAQPGPAPVVGRLLRLE
jgi:hypothetical protein